MHSRRTFLGGAAAVAALPAAAAPARKPIRLGVDNFAVRAMKWKAARLIDYAAELRTDSLFITDLDAFESLEPRALGELRRRAADKGVQLHLGTWSICPTSTTFKPNRGAAEEHLALGIRAAKDLGAPVLRVILGNAADRATPGGIRARIADTVKVLKANRSRARDAGVKVAVENHAGDMQSHELVSLIEEAGRDFVGANMDPGNAVWTLEDPHTNLEVLGPYALSTSMRDSALWDSDNGTTVQWTAMGEGMIDWRSYFERFATLCPGVPVHIETISGFNREFAWHKPEFWKPYADAKAPAFARWLALSKKGKPRAPWKAPDGQPKEQAEQEYQRGEVERSIRFCKEALGLGPQRA